MMIKEFKYNTPIEVTKSQYNRLMVECAGIVAGREENGKYFIKVMIMKYVSIVRNVLT